MKHKDLGTWIVSDHDKEGRGKGSGREGQLYYHIAASILVSNEVKLTSSSSPSFVYFVVVNIFLYMQIPLPDDSSW